MVYPFGAVGAEDSVVVPVTNGSEYGAPNEARRLSLETMIAMERRD